MDYHAEALSSWETNAAFWDEGVGLNGNKYWKTLQEPSLQRLFSSHLGPNCNSRALDLATGNGLTARWLANKGCASVLATDGAAAMLEQAKKRVSTEAERIIEYKQLDVTSPAAFESLLEDPRAAGGFDIVLINMAIMDIADINPLAQALPKLLKPNGIFVATVLHPVFFTSSPSRLIELSDFDAASTERPEVMRGKVIRQYMHVPPYRGVAVYGQPTRQVYFHRPLHELFGTFFKTGLVMDAVEELAFTEADGDEERVLAQSNYTQLPAILSFRLRRGT